MRRQWYYAFYDCTSRRGTLVNPSNTDPRELQQYLNQISIRGMYKFLARWLIALVFISVWVIVINQNLSKMGQLAVFQSRSAVFYDRSVIFFLLDYFFPINYGFASCLSCMLKMEAPTLSMCRHNNEGNPLTEHVQSLYWACAGHNN